MWPRSNKLTPLRSINLSDFGDCGSESKTLSTTTVTPAGIIASIYYNPDFGFWPILRDYFGDGRDMELATYNTLAKAKAAITAE